MFDSGLPLMMCEDKHQRQVWNVLTSSHFSDHVKPDPAESALEHVICLWKLLRCRPPWTRRCIIFLAPSGQRGCVEPTMEFVTHGAKGQPQHLSVSTIDWSSLLSHPFTKTRVRYTCVRSCVVDGDLSLRFLPAERLNETERWMRLLQPMKDQEAYVN